MIYVLLFILRIMSKKQAHCVAPSATPLGDSRSKGVDARA